MATAREEAERILALAEGNTFRAYEIVNQQMSVIVLRTQVMLSLSGIVVTVTGFSGRAIAETSVAARTSIAAGILVVLASAAVAIWGALRLSWLTQHLDGDALVMLTRAIDIREKKSRYLRASLVLFIIGFALYCIAIAQLLLAAQPH